MTMAEPRGLTPFVWRDPATIPPRASSAAVSFEALGELAQACIADPDKAEANAKNAFFAQDPDRRVIGVFWGGYEYEIDLDEVEHPINVAGWVNHLGAKAWPLMTPLRIAALTEVICRIKGWDIHTGVLSSSRETTDDAERAKLSRELRFKVLRRDGHRCRSCGSGPEHGAVLHIDHVHPIAKGGRTTFENLQALCASCNFGKGVS